MPDYFYEMPAGVLVVVFIILEWIFTLVNITTISLVGLSSENVLIVHKGHQVRVAQ